MKFLQGGRPAVDEIVGEQSRAAPEALESDQSEECQHWRSWLPEVPWAAAKIRSPRTGPRNYRCEPLPRSKSARKSPSKLLLCWQAATCAGGFLASMQREAPGESICLPRCLRANHPATVRLDPEESAQFFPFCKIRSCLEVPRMPSVFPRAPVELAPRKE